MQRNCSVVVGVDDSVIGLIDAKFTGVLRILESERKGALLPIIVPGGAEYGVTETPKVKQAKKKVFQISQSKGKGKGRRGKKYAGDLTTLINSTTIPV